MNNRKSYLRFFINKSWDKGGFELFGMFDNPDHPDISVLHPIQMESKKRNSGEQVKPFAIAKPEDLQVIMDELWKAGIRPDCGEGHIGELNATNRHLEDMRTLVFENKTDKN